METIGDAASGAPAMAFVSTSRKPLPSGPPSLYGLLPNELAELLAEHGHDRYRARQVLDWVYKKRVRDPAAMTNVSRALRESLAEIVSLELPEPDEIRVSPAGDAVKF